MPFDFTDVSRAVAEQSVSTYARLLTPVILVTEARGRECFTDTRRLFARLTVLSLQIRTGGPQIKAIWQGEQHVSEAGILALELMLEIAGLENFNRASKHQRGGARAIGTKYQWYFLSEYLGWNWERA